MTQTLLTALLLAGTGLPAVSAAEMQPEPAKHVSGYFYSAGRSYLGVDIQDVTADRLSALKLKEERGVEITMVDQDAPAGKAGLREHDVILEFNGTAVESEEQLRRLIRETPPGRTVTLGISRDGSPMKINVQLADHSKVVAQSFPRVVEIPEIPRVQVFPRNGIDIPIIQTYSSTLGVQTENLTRQLGEFFGVKDGEGVLIRSVEKGSAAEKAGLKAGDVIVRADNEKLTDRTDLTHALRNHRSGGPLNLVVVRDKHEQNFTVTLPDRRSRDSSSLLQFDAEGLQDSLGNAAEALQSLSREDLLLSGQLRDMELLEILPDSEKAMRDAARELDRANKVLEGIHFGPDLI
jgi:predicted metalloprotease with PDZ domain